MSSKKKYGQHEMSIDEIVNSIRGIINTRNKDKNVLSEDILELTNILDDNREEIDDDVEFKTLISKEVEENIKDKLKSFNKKIDSAQSEVVKNTGEVTIEELLKKLLVPELKVWLDENLPHIIETILSKELKRLVNQKR